MKIQKPRVCHRCGIEKIKGFYELGCKPWGKYFKYHLWKKQTSEIEENDVEKRKRGFWHRLLGHDWVEVQPFITYPEYLCLRCGDYRFGVNKDKNYQLIKKDGKPKSD